MYCHTNKKRDVGTSGDVSRAGDKDLTLTDKQRRYIAMFR